ncbi:hypothetical protein SDRG_17053 [Saprolegnia diclina VS20]|uniref:Hsp70-Hsp90 organising protein n=1 Tax=Saprolegnia diclina (strain VS20) TaxID=1156394 RepID=T0QZ80_SAPDV|nr:hypothetical protein SDRG_17053 [Saprolegnia diclina VS20]EQC25058.1 hypothetical protein SDRG_17053 [Saprolegnia diclina VS20]|eukprot:XP_008621507.1 hypothetical protein SDRG_17053 [Saprolegnia diclina VS20]
MAEEAKLRGNRFFTAGQYQEAADAFTEAIGLEPSNAIFYSNRSGAYLKLNRGPDAIADAKKCIELRPEWPKGYSRLGTALFYVKKYAEAKAAYERGLAKDPNDANLLDGLRNTKAQLPDAISLQELTMASPHAKFRTFQFGLRCLMAASFVLYWTAWGSASTAAFAFATFFKLGAANYASFLAWNHGKPQMNAAYAQRVVTDPTTQALMFCLLFWFSSPYSIALLPIALNEGVHFASFAGSLFLSLGSSVGATCFALLDPIMPYYLGPQTAWHTLNNHGKWAALYHRTPQVVANLDVGIGLCLILELLTPARNFMLLLIYWQLLRIRYMISPQLKNAFSQLDTTLSALVLHPRAPTLLATGYAKLKDLMANMVKMPTPEEAQQASAMPKCSIM